MKTADRNALLALPVVVVIGLGVAVAGRQGGASVHGIPVFALSIGVAYLMQWLAFIPAWLLGVMIVVLDMFGLTNSGEVSKVAYSMHLAGAAFASQDLTEASADGQRGAVQVGDPFMEKLVCEACLEQISVETGKKQPEAIALYRKKGYEQIPNYGQYIGVENSVCFEKTL